jgi:hypothetical protein
MCGEDYNYLSLTMYVAILEAINVTYIPIHWGTINVFKILYVGHSSSLQH